jgi:hypothetical protein
MMTRKQLKALVKECLIEILNEGIQAQASEAAAPVFQKQVQQESRAIQGQSRVVSKQPMQKRFNPALDTPMNSAMQESVKIAAGNNSVMASIFADTAKTTLPMMMQGERAPHLGAASPAAQIVDRHTPGELFGQETMETWNQLAFMDTKPGASMRAPVPSHLSHVLSDDPEVVIPSPL